MDPAAGRVEREQGLIARDRMVGEDAVRGVVEDVDVFVEIDREDGVRGAVAHAHHKDDAEPGIGKTQGLQYEVFEDGEVLAVAGALQELQGRRVVIGAAEIVPRQRLLDRLS